MKKIIALSLAVMMLAFTVASCSSGEGEKKTTPPAASTEETTTTTSVVDPVKKGPIAHITSDDLSHSLTFIDDTGNGHNAVASHKLKIVDGRFGNAVYLESAGQHIEIPDSDDFRFSKNDSFTIDVWFKWSETFSGGQWPCVIQKGLVQSEGKYKYVGFWINSSTGALNL